MNIRCSDAWWKHCVLTLMHSFDIVVVDLSLIKAGTDWEIRQLCKEDLLYKTIFIASDIHKDGLADTMRRYFGISAFPPKYLYDKRGRIANSSGFNCHLYSLMKSALSAQPQNQGTQSALDYSVEG
jgi:hypothetical protein